MLDVLKIGMGPERSIVAIISNNVALEKMKTEQFFGTIPQDFFSLRDE